MFMFKEEKPKPMYEDVLKRYESFTEEIKRVRGLQGLDLLFGLRHYYDFVLPAYAPVFHIMNPKINWEKTILVIEKLQDLVKHEANRDTKNPVLMLEWIGDYVKCIDTNQKLLLDDIERHEKRATEYLHSMEGK